MRSFVTLCVLFCATKCILAAYVESVVGNVDPDVGHFQPMVAMVCQGGNKLVNQYLTEEQHWVADLDTKSTCIREKLEILEYCRKIYPQRDIRNIVESSRYYKIDNWCTKDKKCKSSHWVKPYRCLEGPFQSDALLVPEHCLFDHIHNQSVCQSFDDWNHTAEKSCLARGPHMKLHSFAMLLPCGVDIFSGVEFVCCPKERTGSDSKEDTHTGHYPTKTVSAVSSNEDLDEAGDDGDDDDEYYDDDDDQDTDSSSTSTTTTTTERPIDVYFSHFDSRKEHASFKDAQKNLEDSHRERVTKVMKEWAELEDKYQQMKQSDPKNAESFRRRMSVRFQKTVEALEEEGTAEKRQLQAMHQQRVLTIINMRKKAAMDCYRDALDQTPPKTKKIEKCLERLIRALEKDRSHSLHHYRHTLSSQPKSARKEQVSLLEHLDNLNNVANQSIDMLKRVPTVSEKIREKMVNLWHNLRGSPIDMSSSHAADEALLRRYREEADEVQREKEREQELAKKQQQDKSDDNDDDSQESDDKDTNQETSSSTTTMSSSTSSTDAPSTPDNENENDDDDDVFELDNKPAQPSSQPSPAAASAEPAKPQAQIQPQPQPVVGHNSHSHQYHQTASFTLRKESVVPVQQRFKWNGGVYITLSFAGVAMLTAMMVGVVLLRRHAMQRSLHNQGFVGVDQTTPEEKHITSMQVNGYENPTYKYFESSPPTAAQLA